MRGYDHDLAYIHDVGFTRFTLDAAPALLEILHRSRIDSGLVIDLGCGTGVWARELCRAGYDLLGVDRSPSMIDLAKKRVPDARFLVGSLWRVKIPSCCAVTSIGECLNYRFAGTGATNGMIPTLFRRIHRSLRSGGVFVFDIAEPGQMAPVRRWSQGEDWAILVEAEEDSRTNILTRRITTFRKSGALYQRRQETHRLQLLKASDVAEDLRDAGFSVRLLRRYGWRRLPPAHAAFIARKA